MVSRMKLSSMLAVALLLGLGCRGPAGQTGPVISHPWGRLPLRFEENRGQFDERVRYVARSGGMALFLTETGAVMALPGRTVTLRVHEGQPAKIEAGQPLITRSNYFIGGDPKKWRTDVPNFAEVAYRGVRPGVDLVYHGSGEERLEYDFLVAPGASPNVSLDLEGTDGLRLAADGSLELELGGQTVRQLPPKVYQVLDGKPQQVAGRYRLLGRSRVGFAVAAYDRTRPLVIDPVLLYSTYLGGTGTDWGQGIAVDSSGSAYVVGRTISTMFPVVSAYQNNLKGFFDVLVSKLSPNGNFLVYSTYLGGSDVDIGQSIAVDSSGAAYLTGSTWSSDFPFKNGVQSTLLGEEAFISKLAPAGNALVYSTFLGGTGADSGWGIAIDTNGAAYVSGRTMSPNFPTQTPYQSSFGGIQDAFVAKLVPGGDMLAYSTFLGGSDTEWPGRIAVDSSGNAYLVGITSSSNFPTKSPFQPLYGGMSDAFVTKLASSGSSLVYSTFLGGSSTDNSASIALDTNGAAYVVGSTSSDDFPTASPYQPSRRMGMDAFVAKLKPSGGALDYSTYLGGGKNDSGGDVAVDTSGAAFVVGTTASSDFPLASAFQPSNLGKDDAWVMKLASTGSTLVYSSYLGGTGFESGWGIAIDSVGAAYVTGRTASGDFPIKPNPIQPNLAGGDDVFVSKITAPSSLVITPWSVTLPPRGSQTFAASGGSGGYSWTISTNNSAGTIDATSGVYQAGTTGSVSDVITLKDSLNNTATAIVTVTAGISITPLAPSSAPTGTINFIASGGSGVGYTWSFVANLSGGTVDASTGKYTAGSTSNVTDTLKVVDSLGNTATVMVTVTANAQLKIAPAAPSSAPKGSIGFVASGGSGMGYTWTLTVKNSGGTINSSGKYTAGSKGGVSDVVTLYDSLNNMTTATVTVTPGVAIAPAAPSVAPKEAVQFIASDGSGAGYVWSLAVNNSGGLIDPSTGSYLAGPTGKVSDTVKVVDSLGNEATTSAMVGPGITFTPPGPTTPPMGAIDFTATGGSGSGYLWALTKNNSGGTINATTGKYVAGSAGNVTDTMKVTDSLGNMASTVIVVGAKVGITPPSATTAPLGKLSFTATGGSGSGYDWSLLTNNSGGSIEASTGKYTAGPTGSVSDTLKVVDSLGNSATATVSVMAAAPVDLAMAPVDASVALVDAAMGTTDAALTVDAASPKSDAALVTADAAANPNPQVAAGCSCQLGTRRNTPMQLLVLAAVMGLAARLRLRRESAVRGRRRPGY